jgi:DNA (cytosine-5)-methyltransferase 1
MENGLPTVDNKFTKNLFNRYKVEELGGKSIKDKRGGKNNIHSWELELRGKVSDEEKKLMNTLLKERRKKHWAEVIGIEWMDGMPLTKEQIATFYNSDSLEKMLLNLTKKGYLVYEYPKKKVVNIDVNDSSRTSSERVKDTTKPKGYNIVTGKLSFEFSRILNPNSVTPTLVAMDMDTIGVIDGGGLRHLTLREGLRLFGYPDKYSLEVFNNSEKIKKGFDLLGNTVCVPVIEKIAERLVTAYSLDARR